MVLASTTASCQQGPPVSPLRLSARKSTAQEQFCKRLNSAPTPILVVECDSYVYLVPFVEEEDYYFLKTVIPSRKATRDYLDQGKADAED
jgi:hypothetical protein